MGKFKAAGNENLRKGSEKSEAQINRLFGRTAHMLMEIYVLFYLSVFPLCIHDKYFDILSFRFELFWKPTLAYGVIFLILGLLYLISDALYNGGAIRRRFFDGMREILKTAGNGNRAKAVYGYLHIGIVDIVLTVLIILFSISTALAEYPYEAFWGDRGRNQGLFLWLMLYIAYILITRFYKFRKWHIWAYMAGASAVCIWGIMNFFLCTFGMFEHADDTYKYTFVSSIGNINTYNAFTGIFYGVSTGVFIKSKTMPSSLAALGFVIVASFGQIMGLSDNAVLSTGIVLAAAPLLLCEDYGHISRYLTAMLVYFSAMKITCNFKTAGIRTMADADPGIQIKIAESGAFIYLPFVIAALTVVFTWKAIKSKKYKDSVIKSEGFDKDMKAEKGTKTKCDRNLDEIRKISLLKKSWTGLMVMTLFAVLVILVMANSGWHEEIWAPYKNILIFNDSWGTGRGLCWRLGMEFWRNDATLLMKLFGYGPDTFYIITMDRFMNIMQDAGYGMFDSAHNEYFEYFITVGIFGLAAYIAFLYTALREMLSRGNDSSKIMAMGVLAYAMQAVVNIAIPITTPVFMIMLFAGITASKI